MLQLPWPGGEGYTWFRSPKCQNFKAYMQRGIRVCVEWVSRAELYSETGLFEGLQPWRKIKELQKNSLSGNKDNTEFGTAHMP